MPGPIVARLTPLWLRFVDVAGNRTSTIHRLHERYGSTVLTGPNEISLSDISNVKDLYGQQTSFMKAPVYESLTMRPHGVFSLRDKTAHSQRRRLLSHAFSQSNLHDCEPLIHTEISKLVKAVQGGAGKPMDMLNWFRLAAFDIVGTIDAPYVGYDRADRALGTLFLGQSFGGIESGQTPQFLSDVELFFVLADLQWNNPWLVRVISCVPLASFRHFTGAMERLAKVGPFYDPDG